MTSITVWWLLHTSSHSFFQRQLTKTSIPFAPSFLVITLLGDFTEQAGQVTTKVSPKPFVTVFFAFEAFSLSAIRSSSVLYSSLRILPSSAFEIYRTCSVMLTKAIETTPQTSGPGLWLYPCYQEHEPIGNQESRKHSRNYQWCIPPHHPSRIYRNRGDQYNQKAFHRAC